MNRLHNQAVLPSLSVPQVGGGTLHLPEYLSGLFGVVLAYRGAWCPYCNAKLGAFERAHDALRDEGIRVAALSVDDEDSSAALVEKRALRFPVDHSADADQMATTWGAYLNEDRDSCSPPASSSIPTATSSRPSTPRELSGD